MENDKSKLKGIKKAGLYLKELFEIANITASSIII